MPRTLSAAISLRAASAADSEILAQLPQGDVFEVLELAGGNAWGVARGPGLVGYIDAGALGDPA
ncbi:SH3 domain-containing protein [Sphingomonas sp. JC676]|uniref:SH3 domain-containing protein n=1 Tax=Sphingomonas sp. JC676 TaxID=2768065 RepID=UPI00292A5953|nr:SH3 domain-containing protein [Sphingomonas sp. JC676]